MADKTYVCLHSHSHFSFQDGLDNAEKWVRSAKEKGLGGIGITNHGYAGDLIEFYREGKKQDFPVILGTEFYYIEDRNTRDSKNRYSHLNLWVKNAVGYKNLCILNSLSWEKDRSYYKPRIDLVDLKQYSEGLICGSACVGGVVSKTLDFVNAQATDVTHRVMRQLIDIFGGDFYLEIQPADVSHKWDKKIQNFIVEYDINPQEISNRLLVRLGKEYGVKVVATPDAHMVDKKEKVAQDVQIINSSYSKDGWHFYETYYLPTYPQFLNIWYDKHQYVFKDDKISEYLDNTFEVLDKCKDLELKFEPLLPQIGGSHELMKAIQDEGIIDLEDEVVGERLIKEIKTLFKNGKIDLTNYFLLLYDLVKYCKENGIIVGPGRGSACGSLICFGLGITKIDPIKYDLSFERFINMARIQENTLPDVDLDFSDASKAKQYLIDKYGQDKVASVGTVQTLQLKSAIKDVLRVLKPELDFDTINKLTKSIEPDLDKRSGKQYFIDEVTKSDELVALMEENKEIGRTILNLIGQARQSGTHASAVVISPIPLKEIVPMAKHKEDWVTQYTMKDVEYCGLIKNDILGLNTLNDIGYCLELVKENWNKDLTIEKIINGHNDDRRVFDAFECGNTFSVFQFSKDVAKSILTRIPINNIEDLAAITALGRPGTLDVGMDKVYIRRVNGKEPVEHIHPAVEHVLESTYGIMLYQEQVMKVFQILGGFNEVDADGIRRGMGKKDQRVMEEYKEQFIKNAQELYDDIDDRRAERIWKLIEANSAYNFNKSHAIAYAFIGYICQYLKVNYPLEWWCSVLKHETNNDKLGEMYNKLKEILVMPDVNLSKEYFYIKDENIVIPLTYIMRLGEKAVQEIVSKQPYDSLKDFVKRTDRRMARKDIVINLILSGVFDSLKKNKHQTEKEMISSYFDLLAEHTVKTKGEREKLLNEYRTKYQHLTAFELLVLKNGVFPGAGENYVDYFSDRLPKRTLKLNAVKVISVEGVPVITAGLIKKIKQLSTKKGDLMAFVDIEDGETDVSLTLFPKTFDKYGSDLFEGQMLSVRGKSNLWNNRLSVIADKIDIIEI